MSDGEFQIASTSIEPGVTFLEASAGTGKTYTISKIVVRLIAEQHIPISGILVMTFTEAATKELKTRIRSAIQQTLQGMSQADTSDELAILYTKTNPQAANSLRTALATFDEAAIFTIHGFCNRVLKEFAFESNRLFEPTLIKEQRPLWLEAIQDFWRAHHYKGDHFTASILSYHRHSPEGLLDTFLKVNKYPNIEVFPPVSENHYSETISETKHVWRKLNTCLLKEKETVFQFLNSDSLFKKTLRDQLPDIRKTLKIGFPENPSYNFLSILENTTPDKLQQQFLKKFEDTVIPADFFNLVSLWQDALETFLHQHTFYCFEAVKDALQAKKQEDNLLSFDDLLPSILETLESTSGTRLQEKIQQSYPAILVDEFQDTDAQQTELFRRLFITPDHFLFFIGDPKQAIYNFRGADIFSYLKARDLAKHRHTLSTNWRSSALLVDAVNGLFSQNTAPFLFTEIPFLPSTSALGNTNFTFEGTTLAEPLRLCFQSSTNDKVIGNIQARDKICTALTLEILSLLNSNYQLDGKAVIPSDIAILTRSNKEAHMVRENLEKYNLPSVLHSDETVFETPEVSQVVSLLNVLLEPNRLDWLRGFYASKWFSWTAAKIHTVNESPHGWNEIQKKMQDLHDHWFSHGVAYCLDEWIRWSGIKQNLLEKAGGERSATNLLHLVELLSQAETELKLTPSALLQWLNHSIEKPDRERDDFITRLESDDLAIQIVTIHKSKGLQYPIVFVPFAWGSVFNRTEDGLIYHNTAEENQTVFDKRTDPDDQAKQQFYKETLSDASRLLYVALTRAQHACYLFWGDYKNQEHSSIGHLLGLSKIASQSSSLLTREAIEALKRSNLVGIQFLDTDEMAERTESNYNRFEGFGQLKSRSISRVPERGFYISSFSSLASGFKEAYEETVVEDEDTEIQQVEVETENSIFSLPKGTATGNLIHDILENTDFNNAQSLQDTVERLGKKSLWTTPWIQILLDHLLQLLEYPLSESPSLTLNQLQPANCLKEAEFHFPTRNTSTKALLNIFKEIAATHFKSALPNLENWKEHRIKGYLRGFIDLTFEWEGRIYLLDWKSNWLGNTIEDYGIDSLNQAMAHHAYFLQYYLYTLATVRYLQFRDPNFDYETQFGGVYYLFIRGVDKDHPANGVYFDRPPLEAIQKLDNVFQNT